MNMALLGVVTVEPVLFLFMLAVFLQYSVFQDFVYLKVCAQTFNSTVCTHLYDDAYKESLNFVQKHSSYWILASTLALTIPGIIVSTFLGSWSDIFGRKVPIILPPIGSALGAIIYICLAEFQSYPLGFILLASILSGCFGSFTNCIMATMSYISDISTTDGRTTRVMVLESMTFLGGTLGPLIGGAMLPVTSHAAVFALILSCYIFIVVYVAVALPQVRGSGNIVNGDQIEERQGLLSCWHLQQVYVTCFKPRDGHQRANIVTFLLTCIIVMIVSSGEMDVSYLYLKSSKFEWEYSKISLYVALKYGLGALVLLVVGPLLLRTGCIQDTTLCIAGLVSRAAGLILLGVARTGYLIWIVPFLSSGSFLTSPALRSLLSKQVQSHELGKVFACVAMLESGCLLFGSLTFNSIYPELQSRGISGATFLVAAALLVIPLLLMWYALKKNKCNMTSHEILTEDLTEDDIQSFPNE